MKLVEFLNTENVTQRKMAGDVGVHYQYLHAIIHGTRRPSPDLALKIEQATEGKVTLRELLFPDRDNGN
jgi:DNA-binding transcriptional regulator YdaS (Cro superfamily)